jgi:hypothetical protein
VQRFRRQILVASLLASAGFAACLYPTDKSGELEVQMIQVPTLFLKDSLQLLGRVVDANGNRVDNAVISYSSADPTIVSVDPEGLLRAVAVGTTQVTATAVEFGEADPVIQTAIVRGLLEIDSVVPMTARFGEFVSLYGVGLEPDSLFAVSIGGVQAEIYEFTPADPEQPGQFGRLTLWTPPPADRRSDLTVLGFRGGVVFPESLNVVQRDIYELNDTLPTALGSIPFGFRNPALAFEVVPRDGVIKQPADWYTFTNATTQDRTIIVFSEVVGAETFQVFITDSLGYSGATDPPVFIGFNSWTIGPGTYLCGGLPFVDLSVAPPVEFTLAELPFPFALIALKDLPAGEYHIYAPYEPSGEPARYEVVIASTYLSVLNRDIGEENDYCDVATDLSLVSGATLTIDNFRDIDWYRFSVPAPGQSLTVTTRASTAEADLDLYLVADLRPDVLPMAAFSIDVGQDEGLSVDSLPAGDYFLIVLDFPGVPSEYTLDAVFGPPRSGPALSAAVEKRAGDAVRAKRERARDGRGPELRLRPRR